MSVRSLSRPFLAQLAGSIRPMFVFAAAMVACSGMDAFGQVAVTFPIAPTPLTGNYVNGSSGFDFTPTTDITVTSLGFYDHGRDGLFQSHPIGIFLTSSQQLVAPTATVTPSTPLSLDSNFRFTSIAPIVLTAGLTYTIADFEPGPPYDLVVGSSGPGGLVFGPNINYVRFRQTGQAAFGFPTDAGGIGVLQGLYLGPNFTYIVPTPSAAAVLGLSWLMVARRRR